MIHSSTYFGEDNYKDRTGHVLVGNDPTTKGKIFVVMLSANDQQISRVSSLQVAEAMAEDYVQGVRSPALNSEYGKLTVASDRFW